MHFVNKKIIIDWNIHNKNSYFKGGIKTASVLIFLFTY